MPNRYTISTLLLSLSLCIGGAAESAAASMLGSAGGGLRQASSAPLILAQSSSPMIYRKAPTRIVTPPPTRTPDRPRPPKPGRDIGVSVGVGVLLPLAVDVLSRPPQRVITPPADDMQQPPPPRTSGKTPKPRKPAIVKVSFPDPAPVPPMRPLLAALTPGDGDTGAAQQGPATTDNLPEFRPGEIVVSFGPDSAPDAPATLAADFNLLVQRETSLDLIGRRLVVFTIPDDRATQDVRDAVSGDPRTLATQFNYIYRLSGDALTGPAGAQYALTTMHLLPAQQIVRGDGVTIAVIDSGVDVGHAELAGAIKGKFDAAGRGLLLADKHGTAIAGIIGARGELRGVAPASSLLAVRAFWQEAADQPLTSSSEVIARAVNWSVDAGAQILNLSFAGPQDELIADMLLEAAERGVIAVAAAGNNGPKAPPAYPAALDRVIATTATDAQDQLFNGANRGGYVDVAAPGVDIISPAPGGTYQMITGTSMATAHISGLLALVIDARKAALNADQAQALIETSSVDLGQQGRDPSFGAGRADAQKALEQTLAQSSQAPAQ